MACAYASLRQRESAIACLEGALDAGLSDFEAVRSDPDLDAVRGPELDKLLSKCAPSPQHHVTLWRTHDEWRACPAKSTRDRCLHVCLQV